jgi:hypothetical protein
MAFQSGKFILEKVSECPRISTDMRIFANVEDIEVIMPW